MTRGTKREKIETNIGDDEDGRGDHEDSAEVYSSEENL